MSLKLDFYRYSACIWTEKPVRGAGIKLDDLRELERFIEFDGPGFRSFVQGRTTSPIDF